MRRWITNEVVPCLRDDRLPLNDCSPSLSQLCWPEFSVRPLHWQSGLWIRLRAMPRMLPLGQLPGDSGRDEGRLPWWRAVWRRVGFGRNLAAVLKKQQENLLAGDLARQL